MNIIPAIDIKNSKCVRLFQGDYNRETIYSDSPKEIAQEIRSEGSQIRNDLPDDIDDPITEEVEASAPLINVSIVFILLGLEYITEISSFSFLISHFLFNISY